MPTKTMLKHEPIWTAGVESQGQQFPGGRHCVDTVVIGAGLAGLSAAWHILAKRPEQTLLVLEAGRIGSGASTRSTGMLTPGIGQNLAALIKRVGVEQARGMYNQTLWAVNYAGELAQKLGIDCELEMGGQLIVAHGAKGSERLRNQAQAFAELGLPHELLSSAELDHLVHLKHSPDATCDPAAIRLPIAGTLHPGRMVNGLAQQVLDLGGIIYEQAKVTNISSGQPATITIEGGGEIVANKVILATSGNAPDLGIMKGRVLPVHLSVLLTEPLSPAEMQVLGWQGRECIIDSRRLFNYFRLTKDNRIIFGGGLPRYHWGGSTMPEPDNPEYLAELSAEFRNTIPDEIELKVARSWNGLIDYVLDTIPAIQYLPNKPAVIHVGGWSGHGVALTIASGAWVAHLVNEGIPPEQLPWFRANPPFIPFEPARFIGFQATTLVMSLMDRA